MRNAENINAKITLVIARCEVNLIQRVVHYGVRL